MRSGNIRRRVVAMLSGLVALAGVALPATPSQAVSAVPLPDLKARAIYSLCVGDTVHQGVVLGSMALKSSWEAHLWTDFLSSWATINDHLAMNSTVLDGLPTKGHVFIVLGSALSKSGTMTTKLLRRMKLALKALQKYPHAKVLVTGGAPRNGHTEAAVMRDWLLAHSVAPDRILVESQATSTVGNAKKSMAILAGSREYTSYSLISDSSHLRRASILFNAATVLVQEQTGAPWSIRQAPNVAYMDLATAGRTPLSAASVAYAATNVASVFGVLPNYTSVLANPPSDAVLTAISVTAPVKVSYAVGEAFDTTGMVVKAVYDKGAYARIVTPEATVQGFASAAVGPATITATYTEGGVTKVATFGYSVVKADGKLKLKFSTKRIKRSHTRVTVTASVTAPNGLIPSGKVRFYLDGKRLKTLILDDKANSVSFRFPKIAKTGKHTFEVKYLGNAELTAAHKHISLSVKR